MFIVRRDKGKGNRIKHHKIERPYSRKDGAYQFLLGWNALGSPLTINMTKDSLIARLTASEGPGEFEDDGNNLWWTQTTR